jgi:hypothetical protein
MPIEFVRSVMTLNMNRPVELEVMSDQAECPAEAPLVEQRRLPQSQTLWLASSSRLYHFSLLCETKKTESPRDISRQPAAMPPISHTRLFPATCSTPLTPFFSRLSGSELAIGYLRPCPSASCRLSLAISARCASISSRIWRSFAAVLSVASSQCLMGVSTQVSSASSNCCWLS